MEHYQADVFSYFEERIADCRERRSLLAADCRKDEADFEKIRENIYEIFKTVFSVSMKAGGSDPAAVQQHFLEKLEQIPINWRESFLKAEQHGDTETMVIEQLKLKTAEEIKNAFLVLKEGSL